MKTLKFKDLPTLIQERLGFILYDDLLELVHFKLEKRVETFKNITIKALQEYAKYYPLQLKQVILRDEGLDSRTYVFCSNFDKYLEGVVAEKDIRLIPKGIYYMKLGNLTSTNAQWWDYNKHEHKLWTRFGYNNYTVSYFCDYPYVVNVAPDEGFTEDSLIYFMDETEVDFLTFLSFHVVKQIRNINLSVEMNYQVNFLKNIDTIFSELQEEVEELIENREWVMEMWRK